MKTLLILLLLTVSSYSKVLNLQWNANVATENVTNYCIFISDTTPILTSTNVYQYDSYVYSSTTTTSVTVSDTATTYMLIVAYNGIWGNPSSEIKNTPNRGISNTYAIEPNPSTGISSFRYSIIGDAGSYISVETSPDLVNWTEYQKIIIASNDIYNIYFPLTPPKLFFRSSRVVYVPPAAPISPMMESIVSTQVVPTQTIPIRPKKHNPLFHFGNNKKSKR
jgi:hypothetical protein